MTLLREVKDSLFHLFFPHNCIGCGVAIPGAAGQLCIRCLAAMPETNFENYPGNPCENIFRGRLPLEAGTAQFYFTKESLMQDLMHQFKYKGNKELGIQLGTMMGASLLQSGRFAADALVPLPLFANKEKKRGYNQATMLCKGMAKVLQIPVWEHCVIRPMHTATQTRKGRVERWQNMEGKFEVPDPGLVEGKTLLLVDDVVTTGATFEACGHELLKAGNVTLKLAALCIASR
ncbi:MAG: phosphoribosyltransferase family protein [Bacteroidetes bacterium]|nr:phosphoribosyltransferase family protein [Bacteroidota bacterium]